MDHISEEDARRLLALFAPFSGSGGGGGGGGGGALDPAAARLRRMAGYDDLNFRVTADALGGGGRRRFVLKIHNAGDSAGGGAAFDAQNAAMAHVAAAQPGFSTNAPVPLAAAAAAGSGCNGRCASSSSSSSSSSAVALVELGGKTHAVRLLTYIDGAILGARPPSPSLQRAVGAAVAALSLSLASFDHPAFRAHFHEWHMEGLPERLRRKLPLVTVFDDEQRGLVEGALQRLEAALAAAGGGGALPRQVCHTDCNEQNLLVDEARTRVVGLLDWGDATHCWRVVEVAVACAYMMLSRLAEHAPGGGSGSDAGGGGDAGNSGGGGGAGDGGGDEGCGGSGGGGDPLVVARSVLEGYLSAGGPLTAAEARVLPALVGARIAQSLTNGAYAASLAPGNSGYLLLTQRPGWRVLRALQGMGEGDVAAVVLPAGVGAAAAALVPA